VFVRSAHDIFALSSQEPVRFPAFSPHRLYETWRWRRVLQNIRTSTWKKLLLQSRRCRACLPLFQTYIQLVPVHDGIPGQCEHSVRLVAVERVEAEENLVSFTHRHGNNGRAVGELITRPLRNRSSAEL
jgi:hypothetical protein